jgi:hypothetical protein
MTDPAPVLEAVNAMEYYAAFRFSRIRQFAAGETSMADFLHKMREANSLNEEFPGYDLRD